MNEIDDRSLWRRAQQGDAPAFGILFDRHARAVFNHCLRRAADASVADDLTSIVFLEAWRTRGRVRLERPSALPWLLGIAVNVLRNERRARRRHEAALHRLRGEGPAEFAEDADERLTAEQTLRALLPLLERIPERDRETLELCAWSGLTQEEAAATLAVPPGTVRSRLNRARTALRALALEQGLDLEEAGQAARRQL